MAGQKPSVGRIVHYTAFGTPGGEYPSACRAAIITDASPGLLQTVEDAGGHEVSSDDVVVGLCVLNPTGQFFNPGVLQDEEHHRGGTWHWPERVDS